MQLTFIQWIPCCVCDWLVALLLWLQPYQGFSLFLVFVVAELVPSQYKPAIVPSLYKTSLLPEPPTPGGVRPSVSLSFCLTSAALGTAVGHTLILHCCSSRLQSRKKLFRCADIWDSMESNHKVLKQMIQNSEMSPFQTQCIYFKSWRGLFPFQV